MDGNDPRTLPAAEFKARCLAIMDEVAATGEAVIITKHGKPVARLAPLESGPDKSASALGLFRDRLRYIGEPDVSQPALDPATWTADIANLGD